MTLYFEGLTDEQSIKDRFKELAKTHHPDLGGCVETMKEINNQYDQVMKGLYQKAGKSITEIEDLLADSKLVRDKLCEILLCPGIIVEMCGSWLWITGDTKPVKDALKTAGFMWAQKKLAWYWHKPQDKHKRWGSTYSLEEIRDKYGRQVISGLRGHTAIA